MLFAQTNWFYASGIKYIFLFVVSFYTVILAHSTMQCMYDVYKRIFTYLYFDFRFIFIDQLYCKCLIHICWISKEYLNQDSKSWYCHRIRMMHLGNLLYHLLQYAMNIYQPVFLTLHLPPGSKKMAGFYMVKIGLLAGFAVFPSLHTPPTIPSKEINRTTTNKEKLYNQYLTQQIIWKRKKKNN